MSEAAKKGKRMDLLKEFWALFLAAASTIVWVVRIEAKAAANTREIERLWLLRKEDLVAAREARAETNKTLEEIRADIKALLRRHE